MPGRRDVERRGCGRVRPREQQFWYRWSRFVQYRPWTAFVGGLVVLVLVAVPVFSIRLGFGDTGNYDTEQSPRRGPGFNSPIVVAVPGAATSDEAQLAAFAETLRATDGVAFASEDPDQVRSRARADLRRQRAAG